MYLSMALRNSVRSYSISAAFSGGTLGLRRLADRLDVRVVLELAFFLVAFLGADGGCFDEVTMGRAPEIGHG